jgi:hypothetical protein
MKIYLPQFAHVISHSEAVRHSADTILKIFAKTPEQKIRKL